MFDDETLGAAILGNPTQLQYRILSEVAGRVLDGATSIPSMNNGFCVLLDASSSTTAQFVKQEDSKFRALYADRAEFSSELYPHLSDFDYVDFTAKPCTLQLKMVFDKNWIIANAVSYDDNYSLITIPATATFRLGTRMYGMYYPINIMVNKANSVVTTTYDLTVANPLMAMTTNRVSDITTFSKDGSTYYQFAFTVYQFARTTKTFVTSAAKGFSQAFTFTDQFYAARVYYLNGTTWVELSYSLSQMMYNQNTPTAILTPMSDTSTLQIDIPQVYFTNNQVGTQIKVEIYTSAGQLNEAISSADALVMTADLDVTSSAFAAPLASPTTLICVPYDQTSLVGGGNGKDITSMKSQIVSGSLYKTVPISPQELSASVSDYDGFSMYKYIDNITDRIFFAGNVLEFTDSTQVPTVVSNILLTPDNTAGDPSTILTYSGNLITILPTTIFQYSESTGISLPLTDDEVSALQSLSVDDLVSELNTNYYTRQPFHIVLSTNSKYPVATSYNMMNPTMTSLMFVYENPHSAAQLTVTDVGITHLANGTGGYAIKFAVQFTDALSSADKASQRIFMYTTDKSGQQVYLEATYLSSTTTYDVYSAVLPTTYCISTDGYLRTQLLNNSNVLVDSDIDLSQTWNIIGCIAMSAFPSIPQSFDTTYAVPAVISGTWIITTQQTATITLAENMTNIIKNNVTTTWGSAVYATYPNNVYRTYGVDQYLTDANGMTVMRKNAAGTGIDLVKVHSSSDYVLTGGKIVISITESQTTPSATVAVSDTSQLLVGARVDGLYLVAGTTIQSIDTVNSTITLSAAPTAVVAGTLLNIQSGDVKTTVSVAQTAAGTQITLTDTSTLLVGMTVVGMDIPSTVIDGIDGNVVTLRDATTSPLLAGATVECFNAAGPYQLLHSAGDPMTDANGDPIVKTAPANQYGIEVIQFDGRLYAAQDSVSMAYVSSLTATLTANAHILDPVRTTLLERTKLYYKPMRTIGHANFGIGNGISQNLPLGISLDVTYYVSQAVMDNTTLTDEIKELTIEALSEYITSNTTYSTADITDTLKENFSSNITTLSVSGFWRNDDYKSVAILDNNVSPSLAWSLTKQTDQTLALVPDVTISIELEPSDVVTA